MYAALAEGAVSDRPKFRDALNALETKPDETIRLLSLLGVETPPCATRSPKPGHALLQLPSSVAC
jgi:hypothetical protein